MYTTNDKKGHINESLTLKFKVNYQSQVIDFGFFEILDLERVGIDTEILSILYNYTTRDMQGHNSIYLLPWF